MKRDEILKDIKENEYRIRVYNRGESRAATQAEIESMSYWDLLRGWKQAAHIRKIACGGA